MTLRRLPMCAELINQRLSGYTLLDVGCRTKALLPLLQNCKNYSGTDLVPGEGILQCNIEKGLPFDNQSFDVVVALDVIEHLENAHMLMNEALRVAKKAVIISLPNMYYWQFRLNFLLGRGLSGKYAFPVSPILDRHRWVMSYQEATDFIRHNAEARIVDCYRITPERGRTKFFAEPIERILAERWPNLFAYGGLYYISVE